ncbi:hypothetical protein JRQ81_002119 [Phrynocephalus forsythii]|uniref:Uncharacterized protein n=1 Tax=Phrynocephalus forsythii TaxID=171643 RepID=A0A9Q0XKL3_9SAUR|nr:hypothetical protein JRQ81_002119 [Phrynocephalus forsythii]
MERFTFQMSGVLLLLVIGIGLPSKAFGLFVFSTRPRHSEPALLLLPSDWLLNLSVNRDKRHEPSASPIPGSLFPTALPTPADAAVSVGLNQEGNDGSAAAGGGGGAEGERRTGGRKGARAWKKSSPEWGVEWWAA